MGVEYEYVYWEIRLWNSRHGGPVMGFCEYGDEPSVFIKTDGYARVPRPSDLRF
jgi:hypothetical protein